MQEVRDNMMTMNIVKIIVFFKLAPPIRNIKLLIYNVQSGFHNAPILPL